MALELRQELKLSQQLIMTPQLQMAIKLLQLSRLELLETVNQELEQNPALEEVQETNQEEPTQDFEELSPEEAYAENKEVTIDEKLSEDVDWNNYLDEYNTPGRAHFESERRDSQSFESFTATRESLHDHLLWQLLMTLPTENQEKIGSLIIGNLDKDGYLHLSVEELTEVSERPMEEVEETLALMQAFDPIGVCARNLGESLLIQARHYDLDDPLVMKIISNHLTHLENKNYKAIVKALKTTMKRVVSAANIIKSLEPRPGRQYSSDEPHYITPDIYVTKYEGDFVIMLNDDGMPKLRVNSFYKKAINDSKQAPVDAKDYIQDKLRSAAWLIRSIHQRQKTIYKVMESILKFQRRFFEKGVAHLKPMVLRDVAEDIGMHESTISRVTSNKYAHTPQGVFELKFFFNSSVNRLHGGSVASASVQERIRQIIEKENPRKPYSDDKISILLKEYNINVARRTVAKYREMMVVLPSNKRKQL